MESIWCYYLIEKQIYRNKFTVNKMTNEIYFSPAYRIARSMYIAVGGDPDKTFDSVEDIYADVNSIFEEKSSRVNITALNVNITENGSYNFDDEAVTGFRPVNVEVSVPTGVDFSSIGYSDEVNTEVNTIINDSIGYTASIKDRMNTNDGSYLFANERSMLYAPYGDTSQWESMKYMFQLCSAMQYVPLYDTGNVFDMNNMFLSCHALQEVPHFDTRNTQTFTNFLSGCRALTHIPEFDTRSAIYMSGMFSQCNGITEAPMLNTKNVIDMSTMFNGCSLLTAIPVYDTSNVTNFRGFVQSCSSLEEFPQLNTSAATNVGNMFMECTALRSIPELDFSNVTSATAIFGAAAAANMTQLTDMGGFKNLGALPVLSGPSAQFLNKVPNLTYNSVMNIINKLYDRSAAGYSVMGLKMHVNHLSMLSEDEIAIATNKGWNLTV
jgi:surface protein